MQSSHQSGASSLQLELFLFPPKLVFACAHLVTTLQTSNLAAPIQSRTMATFAFRASRALLQDSKEYVSSHTYHYTEIKTPFWRNVINKLRVNP